MTKTETKKLMAVLAATYRDFAKDRDPAQMLEVWLGVLGEIPYEAANAAALSYIRTGHFSPTPADIYSRAMKLIGPEEMTPQEAWLLVSKAVSRTDWLAPEKQFNKLPEAIQRVLHDPETLVEWGKVDESTFQTVVASNFQRSYQAKRASERELAAIPQDVRERLTGMLNHMALSSAKTGG